jgi:phospholipid-binding lipoprotein MlaA
MQRRLITGLLLTVLLLPACATLPRGQQPDPRDRFERTNRAIYIFNDALDRNIAVPVAKTYNRVVPRPVRTGAGNFFKNVLYPTTIVNDLLQGKGKPFVSDTARLVVNTTIGIGGLFDPATQMGLPSGDEDFGQTLGRWGIASGPYIMLPILGPSSARDAFGFWVDQFTDPKSYINNAYLRYGLTGADLLNHRAELLSAEKVLNQSYDRYSFIRNAYLQRREFQVKDGKGTDEDVEFIEDEAQPAK